MKYLSSAETAKKWNISERTVRNYCAQGKISGAFITGKTWNIPEDALRPEKTSKTVFCSLTSILRYEKQNSIKGGIYHRIQVEMTYNSNHIEGSVLSVDQTRYIYETNTIGTDEGSVNVDDIIETANHFRCIDMIIDNANRQLSENFIKELHKTLKSSASDSRKSWFNVGEYKKLPNEVGGLATTPPEEVSTAIKTLLKDYNRKPDKTLEDLLEFHWAFERIHPFQDGNGRVGRLILFKECLKYNIVPFIIDERHKLYYYRGLAKWKEEHGWLLDTCLSAQDEFKKVLDYFQIPYI